MARTTDFKEGRGTVRIIYRTAKTLTDGSHPFWLRITKDRVSKYIATGLSLHPKHWNSKYTSYREAIRKTYPEPARSELVAMLERWEKNFDDAASQLAEKDEVHDARAIAQKVKDERHTTRKFRLLGYFEELIREFDKTGNVGNRRVYRDVANNLARFIGAEQLNKIAKESETNLRVWSKDVPFDAITAKFCNEWEIKMRADGLTEVTLSVKFRTLRAVLNKAIANGYTKVSNYPFARNNAEIHKFQVGKFNTRTRKRAINKELIHKIEAFQPTPYEGKYASLRDTTARLLLAKHLFMFSYYCGGINFIDMAGLRWKNICSDLKGKPRLLYTRRKTGGQFSLPLMPSAIAILDHYKPAETFVDEYIFPILNVALHKTPMQIHNRCSKIMSQVNADLKTIGAELGIQTPLTTYVARHSFATALKQADMPTHIIQGLMKHPEEKTTQIYIDELDPESLDALSSTCSLYLVTCIQQLNFKT